MSAIDQSLEQTQECESRRRDRKSQSGSSTADDRIAISDDVADRCRVFVQRLVDRGHSIVVIEHNLEVIKSQIGLSISVRKRVMMAVSRRGWNRGTVAK